MTSGVITGIVLGKMWLILEKKIYILQTYMIFIKFNKYIYMYIQYSGTVKRAPYKKVYNYSC